MKTLSDYKFLMQEHLWTKSLEKLCHSLNVITRCHWIRVLHRNTRSFEAVRISNFFSCRRAFLWCRKSRATRASTCWSRGCRGTFCSRGYRASTFWSRASRLPTIRVYTSGNASYRLAMTSFGSRKLSHTFPKVSASAFVTTVFGTLLEYMFLNVKTCVQANIGLNNPTAGRCLSFCLDRNLVRYCKMLSGFILRNGL